MLENLKEEIEVLAKTLELDDEQTEILSSFVFRKVRVAIKSGFNNGYEMGGKSEQKYPRSEDFRG